MTYLISERELYNVRSICPKCDTEFSVQIEIPSFIAFELLKLKNIRYRRALEKYANPETHSMDEHGFVWHGDYFDYETARAALEGEE